MIEGEEMRGGRRRMRKRERRVKEKGRGQDKV